MMSVAQKQKLLLLPRRHQILMIILMMKMLHHQVMSDQDRQDLDMLLALVAEHPAARTEHLDTVALSQVS